MHKKLNVLTEIYSLKITRLSIFFPDTSTQNMKLKKHFIYRQSSNNSDLLLICKNNRTIFESLKWTWEPRPNSQIDLIVSEKGRQNQLKGPIPPGRCSSTEYNGQVLIFHISPVYFNYRGTYSCFTEARAYTTITLHTIRGLQKVNQSINVSVNSLKSICDKYIDFSSTFDYQRLKELLFCKCVVIHVVGFSLSGAP